ncbi:putative proliferating cell nuclear antigen [Jaminaea rosea]|uniref:DNA sliding clamp PCNA n=1 Tax=Jaminaea rosea TaxID=1569628 RepID=A0A316UX01_9BASI|nr:putative proliferating cell nuclear antigen [Jaminaea rosea]PWN28443.1 putative proliferating cell nuclear antigen [Jaminaea rosea]
MLEARLQQAVLLKKVLEAVKELVTEANFDCSEDGIRLQAMDNSHVALSSVELRTDAFTLFRCDRPMSIGVKLDSLQKIVRTAGNDDVVTLKKDDDGDNLNLVFEAKNSDRVAEYDMKLLDIDSEHLGIPDTQYEAVVRMSSAEFSRICRDLGTLGESVKIEVSKEGVNFSTDGEIGSAKLTLKQGSGSAAAPVDEDEDDDEDSKVSSGKRKRKAGGSGGGDGETIPVTIELQQAVSLTFSHKYLSNFSKAGSLTGTVALHMSNEVPLLVEYGFEAGHVRFYLAPKLSDDDD